MSRLFAGLVAMALLCITQAALAAPAAPGSVDSRAAEAGTAGCRASTARNSTRCNARALDGPGYRLATAAGASAAASRHNSADAASCRNAAIK